MSPGVLTPYPIHKAPTLYPTRKSLTLYPTRKAPTSYPTGKEPTSCAGKGEACEKNSDSFKNKCRKKKCKK